LISTRFYAKIKAFATDAAKALNILEEIA